MKFSVVEATALVALRDFVTVVVVFFAGGSDFIFDGADIAVVGGDAVGVIGAIFVEGNGAFLSRQSAIFVSDFSNFAIND